MRAISVLSSVAYHLGLEFFFVGQRYEDLISTCHHMVIGKHISVCRDNEAGAEASLLEILFRHVVVRTS